MSGDEELATFSQQFIPNDYEARLPEGNEKPTIDPRDGEIGIYTVVFEQAGVRLLLNTLLCEV